MKKLLYILAPVLLACVSQSVYPNSSPAPTPPAQPTQPVKVVEMVVIADALNVRAEATYLSAAEKLGLRKGQKVKIYLACTSGSVREWVAINRDCTRWVRSSWLR
jgi:hypothetical protein